MDERRELYFMRLRFFILIVLVVIVVGGGLLTYIGIKRDNCLERNGVWDRKEYLCHFIDEPRP